MVIQKTVVDELSDTGYGDLKKGNLPSRHLVTVTYGYNGYG